MSIMHGGDLETVAERSGRSRDALLDFSANINPLGPPPAVVEALKAVAAAPQRLMVYPDPQHRALRAALGAHLGSTLGLEFSA